MRLNSIIKKKNFSNIFTIEKPVFEKGKQKIKRLASKYTYIYPS